MYVLCKFFYFFYSLKLRNVIGYFYSSGYRENLIGNKMDCVLENFNFIMIDEFILRFRFSFFSECLILFVKMFICLYFWKVIIV